MENHRSTSTSYLNLAIAAIAILLNGCLIDEEESTIGNDVEADVALSGSIGDGPVTSASVAIYRNDFKLLTEFDGDGSATYNINFRAKGKFYPLLIDARGGTDMVTNMAPDFALKGAAREPGKKGVANVNPFSTLAYELALEMQGGLSKENLALAETTVVDTFNCGLSTLLTNGPMSTAIDGSNLAEIVRASETLGEIVRRTRDTLLMFNFPSTGDQVVGALASDLTDSLVDGRGGSRVDPRTAAIATIASTLVQLETISNELHVYGVDSTSAMNAAITQVSKTKPSAMVDDLTATDGMLESIRNGLAVASSISSDNKVAELQQAANGLQPGMDYTSVRSRLPDDYRTTLQNVLLAVGGGSDQLIETINAFARSGGGGGENTAPTLSGNPPSEINADNAYEFTPVATDPDAGDTLTFSINNRPAWAGFNTSSGRLSGTPGYGDVGSYANISISVSDGTDNATLGPFAITVQAVSSGSVTLSWTAPTQNEDGSTLTDLAGYKVFWGTTPGSYPNSVTINNSGLTTYVVENLVPGDYEFVAKSFNSTGIESDFSEPVTRTVN